MLKKIITYESLEGSDVTEEFHFHLSKANIMELEMQIPGGLGSILERISETQDNFEIYEIFKKIVLLAVGKKSSDGRHFLKSDDIRSHFESTEAFSELLLEMIRDADQASAFINGIMPRGIMDETAFKKGSLLTETEVNEIIKPDPEPEIRNEFEAQSSGDENKIMTHAEATNLMASDMVEFQKRMQSGWIIKPAASQPESPINT